MKNGAPHGRPLWRGQRIENKGSKVRSVLGPLSSRRKYRRSTPLGRVAKNFDRARRITEVAWRRLSAWEYSGEPSVLAAIKLGKKICAEASEAIMKVESLVVRAWIPPKRSLAVTYEPGEAVRVAKKYREKYLEVYKANLLDSLRVVSMLTSGEVAVRAPGSTVILVAKSHIERRKENREQRTADGRKRQATSDKRAADGRKRTAESGRSAREQRSER